jgi:hypothetical protein
MMVVAYNDESADERTFVVSGLLGLQPDWVELERLWEKNLEEHHLTEFHSAKCELRRPPFDGYERETRDMFPARVLWNSRRGTALGVLHRSLVVRLRPTAWRICEV